MIDITRTEINRIIIHRVYKKVEKDLPASLEYDDNIIDFGEEETTKLKDRINKALGKETRSFKLEIANTSNDSFYAFAKNMKQSDNDGFIDNSKFIADLLIVSQDNRQIPGGYLLIMDGTFENNKHFVMVIKAELQEAFTVSENEETRKKEIELISELFLSQDRDFYKIGFLIEDRNNLPSPNDIYSCYVFDNDFKSGQNDLAKYFYNSFLGFTTSRNDKILTKRFFKDFMKFVKNNVRDFASKRNLEQAIVSLYRDHLHEVIDPFEIGNTLFEGTVKTKFYEEVLTGYERPFTKDPQLLDRSLRRGKIELSNQVKLEGPADIINSDNVSVLDRGDTIDIAALKVSMDNGIYDKVIFIKAKEVITEAETN